MVVSGRGTEFLGISVAVTLLAACAVAARLFTRIRMVKKTGLDDWLILISMVSPKTSLMTRMSSNIQANTGASSCP
jgi:hypothetical protein